MPITQLRLKSLLDAGQSIEAQRLFELRTVADACARLLAGELLPAQLWEELQPLLVLPELAVSREHQVLAAEALHYQLTHRRNEQEARRLARRRAAISGKAKPPATSRQPATRPRPPASAPLPTPPLELLDPGELLPAGHSTSKAELEAEIARLEAELAAGEES